MCVCVCARVRVRVRACVNLFLVGFSEQFVPIQNLQIITFYEVTI